MMPPEPEPQPLSDAPPKQRGETQVEHTERLKRMFQDAAAAAAEGRLRPAALLPPIVFNQVPNADEKRGISISASSIGAERRAAPGLFARFVRGVRVIVGALWLVAGFAALVPYSCVRVGNGHDGFGFPVYPTPAWLRLFFGADSDWHGYFGLLMLIGWFIWIGVGLSILGATSPPTQTRR